MIEVTRTMQRDRDRLFVAVLITALLTAGVGFRLMRLSSVPGINGDEGWWGIQALAWLSHQPYERQTTSGNPTDLFFLIPVALVQTIAPPSFLLLRLVPALVNVLALPVGFWFVRTLYGRTTAWIYTVALAVLPTAIAHSRLCQDPSQSIFWTSVVVLPSLLALEVHGRRWIYLGLACVVFPIALWTHPTNIFIAPFLLLAGLAAIRSLVPSPARTGAMLLFALALLVLGVAVAGTLLSILPAWSGSLDKPWLRIAGSRLVDSAQWFEFAANNARLFNGITIYHYFSGARPTTAPYDVGFVLVAAFALSGFLVTARVRRRADSALIAACVCTWIAFFLFAGPQALRPHAERWGLCLIVPALLVFARGLTAWIEWLPRIRRFAIAGAGLIAALVTVSFYMNYFAEFATTGGRSHLTYVTATPEPKQQALERILTRSEGAAEVTIVTQQWWLFWPMAYLAKGHPHVSVDMGAPERQPSVQEAVRSGRLFFVEFAGTPELAAARDWTGARGLTATHIAVPDASGRELLSILEVARAR